MTVGVQVEQAKALAAAGRLDEALALLSPLAAREDTPWQALSVQADLLKRAGRLENSIETSRRLVAVLELQPSFHAIEAVVDVGHTCVGHHACLDALEVAVFP